MTTTTLIQMGPADIRTMLEEVLAQTAGTAAPGMHITAEDLPDLSAADAARVIGCSVNRLTTLAKRWPEHIRPIIAEKKSVRYSTEQILKAKKINLLNRKV